MKPTLLYDGDCGFCRWWVARWRHATGDAVEYAASQESGDRFPQVPPEAFARAVQLVEPDGKAYGGAEAVFRALAYAGPAGGVGLRLYRGLPGFAAATESGYRLVADHRAVFSRLTRWLWGADPAPPTFHLARWLFLKGLALVYAAAFVSFALQARGLVGARGILPAGLSDAALLSLGWGGAALAVVSFAGAAPILCAALLWGLYTKVYIIGGIFLGYQWDILLLEAGFLAVLAAPWGWRPVLSSEHSPGRAALWLVRWLWFRLLFLSGVVKLASGDAAWRSFSALQYHYESQPLPTVLAWYAHQLSPSIQRVSCQAMFFIELGLPFCVFLPRRPRLAAFFGVNFLMLLICLTGNYTFFNLLAFLLSLPLLDDSTLGRALPSLRRRLGGVEGRPAGPRALRAAAAAFALFAFPVGLAQVATRARPESRRLPGVMSVALAGQGLSLVNAYGLFAVMTTVRNEIVLEGTVDGKEWKPYEFKWKPGDPARRPGWVQPHQPRLDWQMWFASLAPYQYNPWYFAFLTKLLEGSPEVRALLEHDPFPDAPPKYLRSLFYEYRFTDAKARRETGAWWRRELKGLYAPIVTLTPQGLAAVMPAR